MLAEPTREAMGFQLADRFHEAYERKAVELVSTGITAELGGGVQRAPLHDRGM